MCSWQLDDKTRQKYALAERFGLTERLKTQGWAGMSAKELGRIGGCMRARAAKKTDKD